MKDEYLNNELVERPTFVKDLPDDMRIDAVKVKIPGSWISSNYVPRRNYYYVYSLTGTTIWLKTKRTSTRVYPISMLGSVEAILNLKIYYPRKK